jgi:hypothetical protein
MSKDLEFLPEHHDHVDPWHDHAPAEGRPQHEHAARVNTTMLGVAFLVTVGSVVLVVALISIYFRSYYASVRAERVETTTWAVEAMATKDARRAVLQSGGQLDGETFAPIGQAIDEVVRTYADRRADAN